MCVPWELNPLPFALQTQCSTTEPQEQWQSDSDRWHSVHIENLSEQNELNRAELFYVYVDNVYTLFKSYKHLT